MAVVIKGVVTGPTSYSGIIDDSNYDGGKLVKRIIALTQAAYDALPAHEIDADTLYVIIEG